MPWTTPCTSVEIICDAAFFAVVAAPEALEESTPALFIQPWILVDPRRERRRDLRALAGDAGDDDHDDEDGDGRDREQNDGRRDRSRHVPVELDGRAGIATTETMSAPTIGPVIVYVSASSQMTPKRSSSRPDEQPGAAAEVAQPARRGERILQPGRFHSHGVSFRRDSRASSRRGEVRGR